MELSRTGVDGSGKRFGLGRCTHFFWLGVAFDAVGVAVLFTGVFADLLFYDMLLYLGAIIIFISILWWVSWYTGNIEMLPEELVSKTAVVPATAAEEAVRGRRRRLRSSSSGRRSSLSLSSVSNTFLRIRRRRRWRTHSRRSEHASSTLAIPGQLEKEASKDVDGRKSVSSDPEDVRRESVLAQPKDRWGSSHWVGPAFPLPQASTARASKNLPVVAGQPVTVSTSRSHSAVCLTSQCHPLLPVASQSHPHLSLDSHCQPGTSVISQIHPLERAPSQSHTQLPQASLCQPQNLPPASQIQHLNAQESGSQTSVTQVPAVPVVFVQTLQTVVPLGSHVVQDIYGPSSTQASPSHSSGVQEAPKKPTVETVPPHSQELSCGQPDTAAPLPEPILGATQAQPSDPTGRAPALTKGRP